MSASHPNLDRAAALIAKAPSLHLSDEVVDASKKCLLDWLGVSVGARDEAAGAAVRRTVAAWRAPGDAVTLYGARTAPAFAALANGTLAHCLDFDDTHAPSVAHLSAPVWSAVLATAAHPQARDVSEQSLLNAFAVAYEVGAGFGGAGFGIEVDHTGWHSTGVFGALGATAGAASVLRLDAVASSNALALAATQVSGLTGSFGTMAKPFHAGKAAFNGVLSAELAMSGISGAHGLLEPDGGMASTLVPHGERAMQAGLFADGCDEVLNNTFKPYACCLLTHASVDAAHEARSQLGGRPIARIVATVSPLAARLAAIATPTTPLEGKFSTAYCIALGLAGHAATREDFTVDRLADMSLRELTAKVVLVADASIAETAARLRIEFTDGGHCEMALPLARGNPGNPMQWNDLRAKFDALVAPLFGRGAADSLYQEVRRFERPGSLERIWAVIKTVERPS